MPSFLTKKFVMGTTVIAILVVSFALFLNDLSPVGATANATSTVFAVEQGESFRTVVASLASDGLVRSSFAADVFSVMSGAALHMQPGLYKLSPTMSASAIIGELANSGGREVTVTIPEG